MACELYLNLGKTNIVMIENMRKQQQGLPFTEYSSLETCNTLNIPSHLILMKTQRSKYYYH